MCSYQGQNELLKDKRECGVDGHQVCSTAVSLVASIHAPEILRLKNKYLVN